MLRHIFLFLTLSTFITSTAFSVSSDDDLPTGTATADADDELSDAAIGKQRAEKGDMPPPPTLPPEDDLIDDDDRLAEASRESRFLARQREEEGVTTSTTGGGSAAGGPANEPDDPQDLLTDENIDAESRRRLEILLKADELKDDESSMALIPAPNLDVTIPPKDRSTPLTMAQAIAFREFDGRPVAKALDVIITNIAHDEALKAIQTHGDRFAPHFARSITKITAQIFEKLLLTALNITTSVNANKIKSIVEKLTGRSITFASDITAALHTKEDTAESSEDEQPQGYVDSAMKKAKDVLRAKWAADYFMKKVLGPKIVGPLIAKTFHQLKLGTTTYNTTFVALQDRYAGDDVLEELHKQEKAGLAYVLDNQQFLEKTYNEVFDKSNPIVQENKAKAAKLQSQLDVLQEQVDATYAAFYATTKWKDLLKNKAALAKKLQEQKEEGVDIEATKAEKAKLTSQLEALQTKKDRTLKALQATVDSTWKDFSTAADLWSLTYTKAASIKRAKESLEKDQGDDINLAAIKARKSKLESQIIALQEEMDSLQTKVDGTWNRLSTTLGLWLPRSHDASIELAKAQLKGDDEDRKAQAKAYLGALEAQKKQTPELQRQKAELEAQKTTLESQLQKHADSVKVAEEKAKAQAYLDALAKQETYQKTLPSQEEQMTGLKAQIEELDASITLAENTTKAQAYLDALEDQNKQQPGLKVTLREHRNVISREEGKIQVALDNLAQNKKYRISLERGLRMYETFKKNQELKKKKRQDEPEQAKEEDEAMVKSILDRPLFKNVKINGKTLEELRVPLPGFEPDESEPGEPGEPGMLQKVGDRIVESLPYASQVAANIGKKYIEMTGVDAAVQQMIKDTKKSLLKIKDKTSETYDVAIGQTDQLILTAKRESKNAVQAVAIDALLKGAWKFVKAAHRAYQEGECARTIVIKAGKEGAKGAVAGAQKAMKKQCKKPISPETMQAIAPILHSAIGLRTTAVEEYSQLLDNADHLSRVTHRAFILPTKFITQFVALYSTLGLANYVVTLITPEYAYSPIALFLFTFLLDSTSTYLAYLDTYTADSYIPSAVPRPSTGGGSSFSTDDAPSPMDIIRALPELPKKGDEEEESVDEDEDEQEDKKER